jgi:Rrf2 family protein
MLSNTCKYGIRAMVYLALWQDGDEKIGIKRISEDLNLPAPFLGKILQLIAKNKLLNSTKGPHGGFSLAKKADEITLFDIIEIIDGKSIFEECMIGMKVCKDDISKQKLCPFYSKSHPMRDKLKKLFKSQTLGDFVIGIKTVDDILSF